MSVLSDLLFLTAQKSNMDTCYACAIVYRNQIISIDCNTYSTKKCHLDKCCLLCS